MDSCDFAYDCILSAISLSKFDAAKRLCEILLIKDRNKFAFLYGFLNIALNNFQLTKTICSSNAFLMGLNSAFGQAQKLLNHIDEAQDSEKVIQIIRDEFINSSSQLKKIIIGKLIPK